MENYEEAYEFYMESLEITREIGSRSDEALILNNIGEFYRSRGENQKALDYLQKSLEITQEIDSQPIEAIVLNNISEVYQFLRNYPEARNYFQKSLLISQDVGIRELEAKTLSNIGVLLNLQGKNEIAIIFLKESVNTYETIRANNLLFPENLQVLQDSYTTTIEETYRKLADLLLQQNRIIEAQQVLELLKIEELQEFIRGEVMNVVTKEIRLSETEQNIWEQFEGLINLGKRLEENGCNVSDFDVALCDPLFQQRTILTQEFNHSVESFIAEFQLRLGEDSSALHPENFVGEAEDLLNKPETALIYPIVLEDNLWVLWATSGGVVNSVEVPVTRQKLGETVLCFRQFLNNPNATSCESSNGSMIDSTVESVAQELYRYLIPPQLEQEFDQQTANGTPVQNLIFSLDRITRYIPITALHNGTNYLLEDFSVSTILSAGLTRTDNPLPPSTNETSVLALGLSQAVPENPNEEIPGFNALQHVPAEIDAIADIYPGQPLMNGQWDDATFFQLPNHHILHIATHGAFVPAQHDRSYLILGNRFPLRIRAIEDIQQFFSDLSLVVLSACETALGAPDQNGIEINGIAHSFIKAGANTVLASLWQVSDSSTSQLMQQFYTNLAQSTPETPVSISQALREAQLSLLRSGQSSEGGGRGATSIRQREDASDNEESSEIDYSHPYYWAPFILIGNGL